MKDHGHFGGAQLRVRSIVEAAEGLELVIAVVDAASRSAADFKGRDRTYGSLQTSMPEMISR